MTKLMKNLLSKALTFIRENPSIIFSLMLVVIIPVAFFVNTYMITSNFEKNIDKITQSNAIVSENIIKFIVSQQIEDANSLQETVENITRENEKIVELTILKPNETHETFRAIASTNKELLEKKDSPDVQNTLAWGEPGGIAFLDQNQGGRFWKVTKAFTNSSGEKIGLVSISLTLNDTDKMIGATIDRAYIILLITILVVVLFVSNQARLFGYALTLSKLKEIDKMKDTFISMASHELRSPLTAIKGYLEFLSEKQAESKDEESKHYIENITLSVNRLGTLVNDILEVSRIEGNQIPIEMTSFDPHPLISQSIEELRSQAIIKNLELIYEVGPQSTIDSDKERFKQVLVNLIGNAIKYTQKGNVTVSTKIKDNEYLITVADSGIGMSAEDQARLFEKFYRIKNDKTKDIVGTGLGLWITAELVRRMKGKITIESIEGVGSHFTIHLPLAKA
jgi:signal transduction histidine kinase